jgi:uncharacterized protein (DUF58 family)
MDAKAQDYRKYLDPKVLARLGGLELRARMIVEGFFSGIHHSPHHGLSVEFADHRTYAQGDDLRHIDWKLFGKTDKYYIKEYEQETNLEVVLVVDASESMRYRSDDSLLTKYEYASSIAAAIAYLTLSQHDSVGLCIFDDDITHFTRPTNSPHFWKTLIRDLEEGGPLVGAGRKRSSGKAVVEGGVKVSRALGELVERVTHRQLVVIASDFFDDVGEVLKGLQRLRYRGSELIVWHVWDPAELTLPFRGPTSFEGMEQMGRLLADPGALRVRYVEEVEEFCHRLRMGCGKLFADYNRLSTGSALDATLSSYLATRSRRLRSRSSRVLGGG